MHPLRATCKAAADTLDGLKASCAAANESQMTGGTHPIAVHNPFADSQTCRVLMLMR